MGSSIKHSLNKVIPAGDDVVFNLEVLVETKPEGNLVARVANLELAAIEAKTVRGALGSVVEAAKKLIQNRTDEGDEIPWVVPSHEAADNEKRFLVPLHL